MNREVNSPVTFHVGYEACMPERGRKKASLFFVGTSVEVIVGFVGI